MKKVKMYLIFLANYCLKYMIFLSSLLFVFVIKQIDNSISGLKLLFPFTIYYILVKLLHILLYKSYKITTVNRLKLTINAKPFIERDKKRVILKFGSDLNNIVEDFKGKELTTNTHTMFIKKLIEVVLGKETKKKFLNDLDTQQGSFTYERNGNVIYIEKDKTKINWNTIGEYSMFNLTDKDIDKFYEEEEFYNVKIILNKIDI